MKTRNLRHLAYRIMEPLRDFQRRRRFARLRSHDHGAWCAFIGEAGRALLVWRSPFAGHDLSIAEHDGVVTATWDQPPVTLPLMAWDRIVTALAASAANAAFSRPYDDPTLAESDATLVLRLATTVAGTERVMGKSVLPSRNEPCRLALDMVDKLFPGPLPSRVRTILTNGYDQALDLCAANCVRLESIAALIWMRSYRGRPTTSLQIGRILGARPVSPHQSPQQSTTMTPATRLPSSDPPPP